MIIRASTASGGTKISGVPSMNRFVVRGHCRTDGVACVPPSRADEGMWTFHGFPFAKANAALKTSLDQAWLDRVRSATVRLANCTGVVRVRRGPDPHQPSLRRSLPRGACRRRKRATSKTASSRRRATKRRTLPDAGGRRAHRHGRNHREDFRGHAPARTKRPPTTCASPR